MLIKIGVRLVCAGITLVGSMAGLWFAGQAWQNKPEVESASILTLILGYGWIVCACTAIAIVIAALVYLHASHTFKGEGGRKKGGET
jgi:hypothetical protein